MIAPGIASEFRQLLLKTLESGAALIVEGKKDKAALEKLGVDSGLILVLNKKPLFVVAEAVAKDYDRVAILTDLDAEGRKLYGRLNTLLQQLGVKVDNRFRNFLFKNTKLRQIEGIANIIRQ
ncbi:toprim domain-containing protein [Candidatus Woesearchaeota archaeon]|nr:toprim domain-containing protein [Candidatus Woesearchaeota archaeon]